MPTNGSETVGVVADGGGWWFGGGVQELASAGGGFGAASVGGCHLGVNPDLWALNDSSIALTNPNVRQPSAKQSSPANTDKKKSKPRNFSRMYAPQYHTRKYFRTNSFE